MLTRERDDKTETAAQIYRRFSRLPLSKHIASENAIQGLSTWARKAAPRNILEIGVGIGTLTSVLRKSLGADGWIVGFEDYQPCIDEFNRNVGPEMSGCNYKLVRNLPEILALGLRYDLIVVDGGGDNLDMRPVFGCLAAGGVVFIEGDRRSQRELLEQTLSHRPFVMNQFLSNRKNIPGGPFSETSFQGGYSVYRFEPGFFDRLSFFVYRLQSAFVFRTRKAIELYARMTRS